MSLPELFVGVDNFCQIFLPVWERKLISDESKKCRRAGQLSTSDRHTYSRCKCDDHHLLSSISI
jgi:hypothetical protein